MTLCVSTLILTGLPMFFWGLFKGKDETMQLGATAILTATILGFLPA